MQDERQTCTVYVDYENLVASLSQRHSFDVVTLLNQLFERARQQFRIQRINLFGNWTLYDVPEQLHRPALVLRSCLDPGTDATQEIEESIIRACSDRESSTAYLLISGRAAYRQALRTLQKKLKRSVVWTIEPPGEQERVLSTDYELVQVPLAVQQLEWSRHLLLQALIVEVARLTARQDGLLILPQLLESLRLYPSLSNMSDMLLSLALREHIVLLNEAQDPLMDLQVNLNTHHEVTQESLMIEQRILNTIRILQTKRGWVAFSSLEKALSTYVLFNQQQSFRRQWIELLIEQGALRSQKRTKPGNTHPTTLISLNPDVVALQINLISEQNRNTLICVADSGRRHGRKTWISENGLRRSLVRHMTHVEARNVIDQAVEHTIFQRQTKIGQDKTRSGQSHPEKSGTVVLVNRQHELVREKLAQRDRLLMVTYQLLEQRDFQISESLLLEEFGATELLSETIARYWLWLFKKEGILQRMPLRIPMSKGESLITLNQKDPLVKEIQALIKRRQLEVKE